MEVVKFIKNLFWDEEIRDTVNLIYLATSLIMANMIHVRYFKNGFDYSNDAFYIINGFNLVDFIFSIAIVLILQSILLNVVLFVCKISANAIKSDLRKYAIENNFKESSPFSTETKESLSIRFYKIFGKMSHITNDKPHLKYTINKIFYDNGIVQINKAFIVFSILIYINPYHLFSETFVIISISIIYVILIVLTLFAFLAIEYRDAILPNLKENIENT